jgi:hypothetical protein
MPRKGQSDALANGKGGELYRIAGHMLCIPPVLLVSPSQVSLRTRNSVSPDSRSRTGLPNDDNRRMLRGQDQSVWHSCACAQRGTHRDSLCASSLAGPSATPGLTCEGWREIWLRSTSTPGCLCSASSHRLHDQAHLGDLTLADELRIGRGLEPRGGNCAQSGRDRDRIGSSYAVSTST